MHPVEINSVKLFNRLTTMLELEVQLPGETKKIEWDKASPTFCEIKERLSNCGIAKNWCVEILRGDEYVSPDDDTQLKDCKKLRVRASPITERLLVDEDLSTGIGAGKPNILTQQREKPDLAEMFENVLCYIGRVFICDQNCPDARATSVQYCQGTVGLVGSAGESIGCWHTIEEAATRRKKYKMFIEYPNYPRPLCFEAKVKSDLLNSELDLFVAEPVEPLTESTNHLTGAMDVSLADTVHCFSFPEVVDQELVVGYKKRIREEGERCRAAEVQRRLKLPTIFSGRVCYNGWKQAVADYLCFPNCSGGIVVDDYGHLKGVHVAAFRVAKKLNFHNIRLVKTRQTKRSNRSPHKKQPNIKVQLSLEKLYQGMNDFCRETASCLNACKNEVAAFVPIQILEEPFKLNGMHLIRWRQPSAQHRDIEPTPRACLIKPSRRHRSSRVDEEEMEKQQSYARKKLPQTSQQSSSQNPLLWF